MSIRDEVFSIVESVAFSNIDTTSATDNIILAIKDELMRVIEDKKIESLLWTRFPDLQEMIKPVAKFMSQEFSTAITKLCVSC